MHHFNGLHHGADAYLIVVATTEFSCPVVDSIEFSEFVADAHLIEELYDLLASPRHLEVELCYSELSVA